MKINIGAGHQRIDGFVTVDNFAGCNPDYLVNVETEKLPFEDNSVDEVILHHILEHMGEGFFHLMQEIYRVCENGAILDIRVPHPRHDTFLIDPTHKRPIFPDTIAMFSQERNKRDQEAGGRESQIGLMYNVNIEVIKVDYTLDPLWHQMFQQMTNEQCDMAVRTNNNVLAEILIKAMVIK